MTVQTASARHLGLRRASTDVGLAAVRRSGMVARVVALLTQVRRSFLQQAGLRRPVRRVAERAVLADGRVLAEEWTALLRVALVASVVDARAHEHLVFLNR